MGFIHVYTGEGKGKSSSALGMTARMLGHGGMVYFVQFFKFENSDKQFLEQEERVVFRQFRFPGDYFKDYTDEERRALAEKLRAFLSTIEAEASEGFDLIVLDELVYAVHMKLISTEELVSLLKRLAEHAEVIITGRNMPPDLLKEAAYVTELINVKHPFMQGIPARRGIDY